jgi:hypothetical protein
LFIEANNAIQGDLGDLFCENPRFGIKPLIVADCSLCNAVDSLDCCTQCCEGGECNTRTFVPDLDPIWQHGYQRTIFSFEEDDVFITEEDYTDVSTVSRVARFTGSRNLQDLTLEL